MEASFVRLRARPPATVAAFGAALETVLPPGTQHATARAVRRAGLAVLEVAERLAQDRGEHSYHNRHHVAESMLAMGWLCESALAQGVVTREHAALGILAMAGHDLGHDGSRCLDGRLEAEASRSTQVHARRAGLGDQACALLDRLIRMTAPGAVPPERGDTEPGGTEPGDTEPGGMESGAEEAGAKDADRGADQAAHTLCLIAREADLFGSLLPRFGWRLTFALRREWRRARDPAAEEIATFAGRHGFLAEFRPRTHAAACVGLDGAASAQLRAFELVADLLGAGPDGAAGATALDGLRRFRAAHLYRSALDAACAGPPAAPAGVRPTPA